jgi:hypothetical protein
LEQEADRCRRRNCLIFREKAVELEDTFRDLDPSYGKYLATTIMSLDYGPHVLDYLADNPDEARNIVASGCDSGDYRPRAT